jgi:hypothetical protein
MAAGLGFKEFTTGDVLTAADANGYLASQVVMVFASAAARTSAIASPQEGMISYLKDTNSTEYYSGSAWAAIGGGGGGGKVLQVVNSTYSTQTTTTSVTFADTGLTATLTPTSATSKVLVFVNQVGCHRASGTNGALQLKLLRGATSIVTFEKYLGYNASSVEINAGSASTTYLDSPATTSATTYKTQLATDLASYTLAVQANGGTSTITLMEIGA